MGFGMKKTKFGFAPVIRCDICKKECMADNLNFDHDWECKITRIACKKCCRNGRYAEAEAWMEMRDYLYSVMKNAKLNIKEAKECVERIGR